MPSNHTDWRRFVRFGSDVSASQRTSITLFFDRVSSHAFGQEFLQRLAQNGTVTINTSHTGRSSYNHLSRTIDLGSSTFDNAGDGNYIITMLHELTHHAYRRHYVFALHNTVESFSRNLRNEAIRQGLSEVQYNQIVAPLMQILNYEQAASINAAYLANKIFAYDVEASPYYILPFGNYQNPDPNFEYTTPSLGVTSDEISEFKNITQIVSRYSLATPMDTVSEATAIFNNVIDRAIVAGLYSKKRGDQLKEIYRERSRVRIDLYSRSNQLLGFDRENSPVEPLIVDKVDADGVPYGWDVYEVVNGEEKLVESYEVLYQRDDGGSQVLDENGAAVKLGVRSIKNGLGVQRLVRPGTDEILDTNIFIPGNPLGIEFSDLGAALGQQLGYRLAGDDVILSIGASAFLQTVGDNLGDVFDGLLFTANGESNGLNEVISTAFESFPNEFLTNLKSAGLGAISSFLAAEIISKIGINGFGSELANSSTGYTIGQIISNIADITGLVNGDATSIFSGLSFAQLGNVVGGFLGTKLAAEVIHFDTIGGQIGAAVGGAVASAAMGMAIAAAAEAGITTGLAGTFASMGWVGGPIGVAVAAFVGYIAGGLIGSIFGGTPRSGADVAWNNDQHKFVVSNVYAKKGGSKQAARSLASIAADTFNAVLAATGGTLLNPDAVTAGNYGMRKSDYVYRPVSTRDKEAITFRLSSKDEASFDRMVGYGVAQGLTDPDFQIAGGDVYIKRAIYNTFDLGGIDATNFDSNILLGNITSAQSYESYLANAGVINALVSAESDSVFAIETLLTLSRADELGLTRRHRSDWFGGFSFLLKEAGTNAADVDLALDYDPLSGQVSRLIWVGDYILGDSIDIAGQTTIEADAAADVIDLRTGQLTNQLGFTVNGHLKNDIAVSGSDFTALTTPVTFGANARRATVSVNIANEGLAEAAENFLASLANAPAMRIMGGEAVATIVDGAAALPTLMVGDSYAWEGDGYAVFRVSLSKAASAAVTVALTLTNGRASGAGVDFGATGSGNLQVSTDGTTWTDASVATFAVGMKELFVRTAVVADNAANPNYVAGGSEPQFLGVEGNERFTLSANVTAGVSAVANGGVSVSGTGTIVDGAGNEPLVWMDDVVVDEATGQAIFTLSRSGALAMSTTVDFATSDRRVLEIDIAATVDGGDGDDTIYASNLGDNLLGGAGNDTLYGGRLDDWLLGGDGDDILDAGTADQAQLGGDGNYLNGGAGNDVVRGREGSDWLEGGDGIDTLTGGAGDDILAGGAGDNDDLKGGIGADQYLVRRGDGLDLAEEDAAGAPVANGTGDAITQRMAAIQLWKSNPTAAGAIRPDWVGTSAGVQRDAVAGGEDSVVFGAGIGLGDVRLQRSGTSGAPGNDLIIQIMETVDGLETFTGTQLTIRDWFSNPFKRVEWLRFADGNEIRIGDITSFVVGGSGNDVLIGTAGNDFVYGDAGDDDLFLMAGDDVGNGGTGNDMVMGDAGRDLLIGGLGNDELIGGANSDAITGDAGADDIYGGADRDTLSGGRGDGDLIVGGAGDDTFRYARGDGKDTVFDEFANYWDVIWTSVGGWNAAAGYAYNASTGEVTGPGGIVIRKNLGTVEEPDFQWLGRYDYDSVSQTFKLFNPPAGTATVVANAGVDTIEFAPGINLQDVILRKSADGRDLVLAISDEDEDLADTTQARDSVTIKDWFINPGQIEKLAFYQTGVLDIATGSTTLIAGTDGSDGTIATPLQGTAMADWVTGAAGDDVIAGGGGNDILAGNSGFDTLRGEVGDDVLYGGTGNDILDGGSGKDVLVGGAGQDIASYASASAAVRAHLSASWANTGDALGDEYHAIEDLMGGSGADVLGGDTGQNELVGGAGNDTLMGGAGDDTYVWSVGNGADTIQEGGFTVQEAVTTNGQLAAEYTVSIWAPTGGMKSTNYYWRLQIKGPDGSVVYDDSSYSYSSATGIPQPVPSAFFQSGWLGGFARTNGQQVTRQLFDATVDGGQDELEFGANISLSDLTFVKSGNDLIVRYGGSASSQVTIKDQLLTNSTVETLKFADGLSVSLASVLVATSGSQLTGTTGDDLMAGQAGALADNLSGGDGNDTLVGYAGNDTLLGDSGDDVLEGGLGADTLDGGAHIVSSDGLITGDTARYVRSAAAVAVDLNLSTAQGGATNSDAYGDILSDIENVTGSAFADTLTGNAADNRLFGLDGADTIRGGAGNDVVTGDGDNDTLYGDAGEDNIAGGDGDDVVYGGTEKDVLDGGDGIDRLYGEAGNDSLTGGAGSDTLDGGDGDDILSGDADNDTLTGGVGKDVLSGGTGSDTLGGGEGDDRYVFGRNTGSDTLTDFSGTNALQFDTSASYEQIWMTRVGNDLRVAVIGGDTVVTVKYFFVVSDGSRVKTVETTTHALFLDHPDTLNLVNAMTAASVNPAVTPASMPTSISGQIGTYWHAGGKAKPTAPAGPRRLTLAEDSSLAIDGGYGVIDHDQNVTTYSLKEGSGPTLGTIANLDPATGALTYTPNPDANGADSFTLIATDADGQSVEISVAITVTPVNDAPRNLGVQAGAGLTVLESTPGHIVTAGTVIGQFTATDPEGGALSYSLVDHAGMRFAIGLDGKLSVANPSAINFENAQSHTVRVRVMDSEGAWYERDFVVAVQNGNDANTLPVSYEFSVTENVAAGTIVGAVVATDGDQGGDFASQRYYFWDGTNAGALSSDGRYAIDAVTGQITVNAALDFEGGTPANVYQVVARDNAGAPPYNQVQSAVTIAITDINEAPVSLNWSPLVASVAERDHAAAGSSRPAIALGTISVTDPDTAGLPSATYSYTLSDSRFEIIGGTLRLKQDAWFDFEAGANVVVTVTGTDQAGAPFSISRAIAIAVADQDDIFEGTVNADTITGQSGRDVISGFAGNDHLNGGLGNDSIDGGDGDDIIDGGEGNDALYGRVGSDAILGDAGNDTLYGGAEDDRLFGGDGNDSLYGEAGSEGVRAAGTESWRGFTQAGLSGGVGDDLLDGGDGDDYLDGGVGADQLVGGVGFDGVDYSASTAAVAVNLTTGSGTGGHAQGDTLSGIELVNGSAFGDNLTGSANSDVIYGGAGNDTIFGGAGNDYLFGGDGNDTINAEAGDDLLDGGAGDDTLNGGIDNDVYIVTRSSGADTINNYDPSGDDVDVIGFNDAVGTIADQDLWFERIGDDLKISVVGTASSVRVANWYVVADAASRANHKVDFIIANTSYSRTINIEGLVTLMANKAKPATAAERDALMADLTYKVVWATHWNANAAPVLSAIAQQTTLEDTVRAITVTATDDITPNAQVQLSAQVLSGTNVLTNAGIGFSAADGAGRRTMTINPVANASGTARVRVTATDAGGVTATREFDVVVSGVADTPTITQFSGAGGTSGYAGGIPLNLAASFPDTDGSEFQEIWIIGMPSGVTLSAGTYDSAAGVWKLRPAQTAGLKLNAPAGWSQDLVLSVMATASEAGQTAASFAFTTKVVINAAPTGVGVNPLSGQNWSFDGGSAQGWIAVNATLSAGSSGIIATGTSFADPILCSPADLTISGRANYLVQVRVRATNGDFSDMPRLFYVTAGHGESESFTNVLAPMTFKANEWVTLTFDMRTLTAGGYDWLNSTIKRIRFDPVGVANAQFEIDSILVGYDASGVFVPGAITPSVAENSANGAFIGNAYAIDPDAGDTATYTLIDNANGRFALTSAGLLSVANGALLDYEAAASHAITVRVTDSFGQFKDQTLTVAVTNVNETPNAPGNGVTKWSFLDETGLGSNPANAYAVVASFALSDPDGTVPLLRFADGSTSQGLYYIDGNSVRIHAGNYYDFEWFRANGFGIHDWNGDGRLDAHIADVRVKAFDGNAWSGDTLLQVFVSDVNEAPNAPGNGANRASFFDETGLGSNPANAYAVVASFALSDPDGTVPLLRFADGSTSQGRYYIDGNTVRLNAGFNHDFEWFRANGYTIHDWNGDGRLEAHIDDVRVKAFDGSAWSSDTLLQVFVSDVNEQNSLPVSYAIGNKIQNPTFDGTWAWGTGCNPNGILNGQIYSGEHWGKRYIKSNFTASAADQVISMASVGRFAVSAGQRLSVQAGLEGIGAIGSLDLVVWWFDANGASISFTAVGRTAGQTYYDTKLGGFVTAPANAVAAHLELYANTSGAGTGFFSMTEPMVAVASLNQTALPTFTASNGSGIVLENCAVGTLVGTVLAGDPDGPGAYADQRYYFWDGTNTNSISADGRFAIDPVSGQIRTRLALDYEYGGPTAFTYAVVARDNAGAAGFNQAQTTVALGIGNVNEPHSLASNTGNVLEGTFPPNYTIFNLRSMMLVDPEGVNMNWRFANGTMQQGIWSISPDGNLFLTAGYADFEALTTYERTRVRYDANTGEYLEETVTVRDNSRATQVLSIQAYDGTHSATANFTAKIDDRNEGPTLGYAPRFLVRDDQKNGYLGTLRGVDPETGSAAVSYSIAIRSRTESFWSPGSSADVDNTGNPAVWVNNSTGQLYFDTPGDGEWEGGIRYHPTLGGRWYYQLDYLVDVTMADASGVSQTESFTITFLKHDTSVVLPIVLDLDGDGLELVDFETSAVTFDMDLDGIADNTGWVAADDGMLVLDRNGNGVIDNMLEISFARDDESAVTDVEGLRAWDTNHDGVLDAHDTDFGRFQIWRDVNQNGISDAGELFSLTALGVNEINLTLNPTGAELVNDTNVIFATSSFTKSDGTTGAVGDVSLAYDPSRVDPDETSLAPPVILDLDGDGAGLVELADSKTRFDMNGDGIADRAAWIEEGDAFLALDRNGNGLIDDISEISFVRDKEGAKTDLEGLSAFDSNGDGVLDGEDERFVEFRLWRDGNSNGKTDAGELLSLAEAGVISVSLTGTPTGDGPVKGRNLVYNTGSYTLAGGAQGKLLDAGLAFKALQALPEIEFQKSTWEGKAKNWRLTGGSGTAHIVPRSANGTLSGDAGQLSGAAMLSFGNRTIGMLSTVLLDLDGDGLEAKKTKKSRALFDMNGDGSADDTGWMSGGDGMLAIDRDGDGFITDESEISFLSEKEGARSAWEGLVELDNTKDGKLDKNDARFAELKVWVDANGDGINQEGELESLAEVGIAEIGLRTVATNDTVKPGRNLALSTATFKRENGVTGTIGNVAMAFNPALAPSSTPADGDDGVLDGAAFRAVGQLAAAMSTFGAHAPQGVLHKPDANGMASHDWFAAATV